MNSFNLSNADWTGAWHHWQLALATGSWHPWAVAAGQLVVAGLCLAAGRQAAEPRVWNRSAAVLLLLALSTLLALDLLVVELSRALARNAGWYGARRELQVAVLGMVALLALWGLSRAWFGVRPRRSTALRTWPSAVPCAPAREPLVEAGVSLLLALTLLRFVSLHATDAWLGVRWAGLSLVRLLEGVGLGLVGLRAAWLLHFDRS